MDFINKIRDLSERIPKLREQIQTEEATKTAFIMPFIQALEYDVFNPSEVVPEFIADIGIKKGEKVDYAIIMEGKPKILIECKCCGQDLDKHNNQLYRYFSSTDAKFAIITDGIVYKFYTELDEKNKLDSKPFFIFDMLDFDENQVNELKKFCKSSFDEEAITSTASELKYTREIKNLLIAEYNLPSEEFVRLFAKKVYEGILNKPNLEKFERLTKKAFKQFVNELMNQRFRSALVRETPEKEDKEINEVKDEKEEREIVTTIEELEGFAIVKSILMGNIELERVFYRDNLSYFNILLDNSIRKTLCRLHFNTKQKYISFLDENKKDNKYPIENLNEIYKYSDLILQSLKKLLNQDKDLKSENLLKN